MIRGQYKEYSKEPDVIVSEHSRSLTVENLIRLTHYVLDMSTIVHVMDSSGEFHSNFEKDLDNVADDILPKVTITLKQNIIGSFHNDAYGEADLRAKAVYRRFKQPLIKLHGNSDPSAKTKWTKKFSNKRNPQGRDLAKDIIQNAAQNIADFWLFASESMNVDSRMHEEVLAKGQNFSV